MSIFTVGRMCVKLAGRDAGRKCVVVEEGKGFVVVDGNVRRKKVNVKHLEPLSQTVEIGKGSHEEVVKAFEKLGLAAWNTKAKKSVERPKKQKKVAKEQKKVEKKAPAKKAKTEEKKETPKPAKKEEAKVEEKVSEADVEEVKKELAPEENEEQISEATSSESETPEVVEEKAKETTKAEEAPVETETPVEEKAEEKKPTLCPKCSLLMEPGHQCPPEEPKEEAKEEVKEEKKDDDLPTADDLVAATKAAFDDKGDVIKKEPFAEQLLKEN